MGERKLESRGLQFRARCDQGTLRGIVLDREQWKY